MKNKVRVIRSENKTIVIYSEPAKGKKEPTPMDQRPFLVNVFGRRSHYIMPDGTILPIRHGVFWRFIKLLRPSSRFAV